MAFHAKRIQRLKNASSIHKLLSATRLITDVAINV